MSADQLTVEQLQEQIEKEYVTALQLIHTISYELHQIKHATSPGSQFEANIVQNVELMSKLAQMQQLNLPNLLSTTVEENVSICRHNMSQEE